MKLQFANYLQLLELTIQDNNWRHLHPGLRYNWARVRELKDTVDHIYHELYLKDKWDRDNENDRLLVSHVKDNLNFWSPFSKITSIEFCKRGYPTIYDLKCVLEVYIRAEKLNEPLDLEYNEVVKYLAESFKKFSDTSKENAKFNSLDKAFGIVGYQGQHHKQTAKNPFVVPRYIKNMFKQLIEQNDSLTSQFDNNSAGKGATVAKEEWSRHKWQVLNEYLYKLCLKGRGQATLTDKQINLVKRNWNKIELPKVLKLKMRTDIPRLTIKEEGIQIIKAQASDTKH
jgi:hypothetical protein